MAGNKRERELARAKYERQAARRARRASTARRRQVIVASVVVVALVLGSVAWAVWAVVGRDDVTASPSASALATAQPTAEASAQPSAVASTGVDCRPPGTVRADNVTYGSLPTEDPAGATSITFGTNCGDIVVALDAAAPKTVASEVFLAKSGFYEGTVCHRLTTDGLFVLQCGDPKGDGTGGPGYTVPDENLPGGEGATYPAGTVAMANAGPGTSGSQFFIVYEDTVLPGDYTIWGTVTEGLDIVRDVAAAGTADGSADGAPLQTVYIESTSIQSA